MALDLGELVGYLKLDTSQWDEKMDKVPGKMGKSGKVMGATGLALGAALGVAVMAGINGAIDAEQSLANVSASFDLTEQEAATAGRVAGEAYRSNFGESVEQAQGVVGGLMATIEEMGTASDAVLEATTAKVLTYSNAFEVDTADAINSVSQLINSGLAADTDEAMDLMTSAMQKVPEALRGDLTDAITEYGPHLANMGYSGEEAFAMLVKAAEGGQYGIDKTGDAMKELSIRSTDMSAASTEAYEAMGLDAQEMANKMLAGGDSAREATDQIVAGLLSMDDPAAQANAAIALFGTPLEDLSVTEIPNFLGGLADLGDGMGDAEGAAQRMTDTVSDTAASGMASFQRELSGVFVEIGANFLPALTSIMGFLNDNKDAIPYVVAGLAALALGLGIAAAAQWVMNSALLASPLTWIIVGVMAVIAAVVLLVANWDTVVAWLGDVWGAIVDWFKGTLDSIAEWWGNTWQSISDFFTGLWTGVMDWWKSTTQAIVDWWNDLWTGVGEWFTSFWNGLVSVITNIVKAYVSFWTGVWNGVVSFFKGLWQGLKDWAVYLISTWIGVWKTLWNGLSTFLSGLWGNIVDGAKDLWQGLIDWFGELPEKVKGFFSGVGSWLFDAGKNLVQGLLDGVKNMAGSIGSFFLDLLPGWIRGPFKKAMGIDSPSKVFKGYGRNTVEGYLEGIAELRPDLDEEMANLVDAQTLTVASNFSGSANARALAANAKAPVAKTVNYYAAENQSLSAEEALFHALASPRVVGV